MTAFAHTADDYPAFGTEQYVYRGNQVIAQAGGGIVADSVPAEEYAESLDKAGVLLSALNPDWRAEDG